MKNCIRIVVAAAVIVLIVGIGCLLWNRLQAADNLIGTWRIYEGGNVAPDVLVFTADGTGTAYALDDAYHDNGMTNVQIPRSCLKDAEEFRWDIKAESLTFLYENGKQVSYEMSFYTMADVRMLSLQDGVFGGGWVPAGIVD